MTSRSLTTRLVRLLGTSALLLALTAPVAMGKEITSGGGGGTATPTPTASPCATIESFTFKASKGGRFGGAEVDASYNVVSCSTNDETLLFDMTLSGVTNKVVSWSVPDMELGTLAPRETSAQKWNFGGLPFNTLVQLKVVVKDAGTGATLATWAASAVTPQNKP